MSAAGYTPILLYASGTTGNLPTAGNLTSTATGAELALNYFDGKLFYKDAAGVVQVLASKGSGTIGGSNTQVQFNNSGVLGGSANFTWSGTVLAITGSITATADSTFSSTGSLTISKGTTAQQPGSPTTGMLRYNTTSNQFEGYSGSSPAWNPVGGSSIANDIASATSYYPIFVTATSGTALTVYTSDAKYLYKPSTGELTAPAPIAGNGLLMNASTVASSYTVAAGNNAISVGPITVASGQTVTISSGQRWVVL
jgi:hypothetical protein